ncbi:MAG: glycosyltransferase family 39 protein [Chthoniobacteraceae bacterium]
MSDILTQSTQVTTKGWLRWNWMEMAGLLVVSLAFVFVTFRGTDPAKSPFLDLRPHPDCVEYAAVASRIYQGLGVELSINGVDFPSRYPVGFPLALALLHPFFGGATRLVIVWAPILFLLASAWVFYALLRRLAGKPAAWAGVLLYVSNPCILLMAGGLYSECLLALLTVLYLGFFIEAVETGASRPAVLFGVLFGFSLMVRIQVVVTLPFFVVAWLWLSRHRFEIRPMAMAFCGAAPFGLALGILQWRQFGSPFVTGYAYHLEGFKVKMFAAEYPGLNIGYYLRGFLLGGTLPGFSMKMPFVSLGLPVLAIAGMFDAWRKGNSRVVIASAAFMGTIFLFFCCYLIRDIRFFIQMMIVYFAWAGAGAAWMASRVRQPWRAPVLAGIVAVALGAPLGTWKTPAAFTVRYVNAPPQRSQIYLNFLRIDYAIHKAVGDKTQTALFTTGNLALLDFYTDEFLLYPVSKVQEYARVSKIQKAFPESIDSLLLKKVPIYIADMGADQQEEIEAFLQIKEDFEVAAVPCPLEGGVSLYKIIQRKQTVPGRGYWEGPGK